MFAKLIAALQENDNSVLEQLVNGSGAEIIECLNSTGFKSLASNTSRSVTDVKRRIAIAAARVGNLDVLKACAKGAGADDEAASEILLAVAEDSGVYQHKEVMKYCIDTLSPPDKDGYLVEIVTTAATNGNLEVINLCTAKDLSPIYYSSIVTAAFNAGEIQYDTLHLSEGHMSIIKQFSGSGLKQIQSACAAGVDVFGNNNAAKYKFLKHCALSIKEESELNTLAEKIVQEMSVRGDSQNLWLKMFRYCIECKNVDVSNFYGKLITCAPIKEYVDSHKARYDLTRLLRTALVGTVCSGIATVALYSTSAFVPLAAASVVLIGIDVVLLVNGVNKVAEHYKKYNKASLLIN